MTELLTTAQMRAIEADAIALGAVTGLDLMEAAGKAVVRAILETWPEFAKKRRNAVVLCGPGNNGGDGFVVARLLRMAGWSVEVYFAGDATKLPPDAMVNYALCVADHPVHPLSPSAAAQGPKPDILVDALLGIGAVRPLPIAWAQSIAAARARKGRGTCRVVAVDCPSGLDCDSGEYLLPKLVSEGDFSDDISSEVNPRLIDCDLCVTFHRPKPGHYLTQVGKTRPVVADIGLPHGPRSGDFSASLLGPIKPDQMRLICPAPDLDARALAKWIRHAGFPGLGYQAHKYMRGHVLVLGGGPGKGGAARMAARAALRVGAGLVTLGVRAAAIPENAAQLNAIMLQEIGDAGALTAALADDRITSVCIGPGMGVNNTTRDMVLAACTQTAIDDSRASRRLVLDADALTVFQDDPSALFAAVNGYTILTPHQGEFARLFPELAEKRRLLDRSAPVMSPVEAVRIAAKRAGCMILLKGAATIIASPDGAVSVHAALYDRAAPWLGTAGAGDVLAGLIAGIWANPLAAGQLHQAAEVATYLHVACAREFGPGLIAEDLPEMLPRVLRRILGAA